MGSGTDHASRVARRPSRAGPRPSGAVSRHGRLPRPLAAQLAPEQHDGPQVLHRHGEAQLRDEIGAPDEWFEAQAAGKRPRRRRRARRRRRGRSGRSVPAASPTGRGCRCRRPVPATIRRSRRPASRARARRWSSPPSAARAARGSARRRRRRARPVAAPAKRRGGGPRRTGPGQAPRRELAGEGADQRRLRTPSSVVAARTGWISTLRREIGASRRWRTSAPSRAIGPPSLPLRRPRAMEIATNAPSTAGPWVVTLAISSAVAGSSVTSPLSHRMRPPPTSAAR